MTLKSLRVTIRPWESPRASKSWSARKSWPLRIELLERAREGEGRLVLLEGPAGIGKTRLLQAARDSAQEAGMRVLTARATELERDFPFALVRQLFEPVLHVVEPSERDKLLADAARPAGPVVGVDPGDGETSADASERRIAGLAAEGLTNRQIAQTLFLSVKTVESHLRAAYRKLDISSRGELRGVLEQSEEPAAAGRSR